MRRQPDEAALRHPEAGTSIVEMVAVVAVVAVLASVSAPLTTTAVDASRVRLATAFISSRFHLARVEAVSRGSNVGVVFDFVGGDWQLRVCRDGNGNGLRRAELSTATDPCFDGPHQFSAMFPGVQIAVDPALIGPVGEPGSPDPVRFGTPDIASFSESGSCTSGSLYLRSARGQAYTVRLAGTTGRLRVFRYDVGPRAWVQP